MGASVRGACPARTYSLFQWGAIMGKRIMVMPRQAPLDTPRMKYLLRLMMLVDAMRSTYAWVSHVFERTTETTERDRLWALVVSVGQAGEAIRVIKDGSQIGYVSRSMLESAAEKQELLLRTWDDCMSPKNPQLVRAIHRIRDRYFAHWDDHYEAVGAFLKKLSQTSTPFPILETDTDGTFLTAHYPWASEAISADIVEQTGLKPDGEAINRLAEYVGGILNMAEQLAAAIALEEGIRGDVVDA